MIGEAKGRVVSQKEFAKIIGTSPATIQSVELGRLNLSHSLARRIGATFSADPASLLKKTGSPLDWLGRPYRPEWFKNSMVADIPQAHADKLSQQLLAGVEAVLMASNAPSKKRFHAVMTSLREWIQTASKDFGLSDEWKRALAELRSQRSLAVNIQDFLERF